jgi:hypothetical protein
VRRDSSPIRCNMQPTARNARYATCNLQNATRPSRFGNGSAPAIRRANPSGLPCLSVSRILPPIRYATTRCMYASDLADLDAWGEPLARSALPPAAAPAHRPAEPGCEAPSPNWCSFGRAAAGGATRRRCGVNRARADGVLR